MNDSTTAEHGHDEACCAHSHDASGKGARAGLALEGAFLAVALAAFAWAGSDTLELMAIVFVGIILEAFPFMLVGSLVGGVIEIFVPRDIVTAILPPRGRRTVFIAAALGVIFPVCECAVVPVVRRLLRKGVPFSAAIAYLLGGPIVNPIVAASTAVAYKFDWAVVGARMACGYAVAVVVGLLVGALMRNRSPLLDDENASSSYGHDHSHGHGGSIPSRMGSAIRHAADDFVDIGRFLVIGAFIAALIQTLVSRDDMVAVTSNATLSALLMMALAVLLNLCSEADAFVAASFRTAAPLVAQLAFMVLGPMLDIKLLMMYLSVFRKRAIVAIACLTALTVLALMSLIAMTSWGVTGR